MDNIKIDFLKKNYKEYKNQNDNDILLKIFHNYFNKFDYIFY